MADPIVFRLSSVDQGSARVYIRYALCYPCGNDDASVDRVATNLGAALKRGVSYIPILAGTVHPVPTQASSASIRRHTLAENPTHELATIVQRRSTMAEIPSEQRGQLEVQVTLEDVETFKPTFKTLGKDEFPHSYDALSKAGMPAMALIGDAFTPLPDTPDIGSPALAVQGSFISGGVIVAIYLHHSVAGAQGLAALMRCMSVSEDVLPGRFELTTEELRAEALEQSRFRDRLSGSRGYQASFDDHPVYKPLTPPPAPDTLLLAGEPACRVLAFSLKMLDTARDLANDHFLNINGDPSVRLSRFDCMVSILWKAITRARWPFGVTTEGQTSALVVPVNIRKCMEPLLDAAYYGNIELFSYAKSTVIQLGLPFDVSTIGNTAHGVRRSFKSLTEPKVRSAIATINECEDLCNISRPGIDFENDVVMTNWVDLPIGGESTLQLGLGAAKWTRQLSRDPTGYDCVLLPLGSKYVWEVMVQLAEPEMGRLLEDPGLQPFLLGSA